MGIPGKFLIDDRPNSMNLLVGNGQCTTSDSDEAKEAFRAKNLGAFFRCHFHVGEYIAGKKRNLDLLAAIAPAVNFGYERTKGTDSLLQQPLLDHSLMART